MMTRWRDEFGVFAGSIAWLSRSLLPTAAYRLVKYETWKPAGSLILT